MAWAQKRTERSELPRTNLTQPGNDHLVIHDLHSTHRVGLPVLLKAAQGRLAGHFGADGPVIVVGVQRTDWLTCLPGTSVPVQSATVCHSELTHHSTLILAETTDSVAANVDVLLVIFVHRCADTPVLALQFLQGYHSRGP